MRNTVITALLTLLLFISPMSLSITSADTSARQDGSDDDDDDPNCKGMTFEDLFVYDYAAFDIEILPGWATADVGANSWVNESNAAIVRDNLDGLLVGFEINGGNNDWLSTDEREGIKALGPSCIKDMNTRIGLKEGVAHRGEADWNDFEFVEKGITLLEENLIPEGHIDERDCSTRYVGSSADCREVPVQATDNLEIAMELDESETNNARFNQLPNKGHSNFTLAYNASNVSAAQLVFTFPAVQGLRISESEFRDNGVVNTEIGLIVENYLADGRLQVIIDTEFDRSQWASIKREFFIDFTTDPPVTNDIPIWTAAAPANGTVIPMFTDNGQYSILANDIVETWATDSSGWLFNCSFEEDVWSVARDSSGSMLVNPGTSDSGTAVCTIVDQFGAESEDSRTLRFGMPATFSGASGTYSDSVEVTVNPTLLVQNIAVDISAKQGTRIGQESGLSLSSTAASTDMLLSGLLPGSFKVKFSASANGMLDWNGEIDLGMKKLGQAPALSVNTNIDGSYITWSQDQFSFTVSGTYLDPDGEDVTLTATICNQENKKFIIEGQLWEAEISTAVCSGTTPPWIVNITATDASGMTMSFDVEVSYPIDNTDTAILVEPVTDEGLLPSLGMLATIVASLCVALVKKRT
jgi:hypothetical protein